MIKIKRILFIALMFCLIGSYVYGFTYETFGEEKLKNNIEEKYGMKIIIPMNEDYKNYKENLMILDKGLKRFPQGVIKEITEFYFKKGISTNVIIGKTEKISDLFSEYKLNENTAELYLNTLQNSIYYDTCTAPELGFVHEMAQYESDYLFKVYGYEKLKGEFEKINAGYAYGKWGEGYNNVFVNEHSAMSFEDDITDLIWHLEMQPDVIRNINGSNFTALHKKIEYLVSVIDQSFSSITIESRLWLEALPQKPDVWAIDAINAMNIASLIPKELDGIYNSYITKEDFYSLAIRIIERKLGKDNYIKFFELIKQENSVTIDPVRGEMYVDNGFNNDLSFKAHIHHEKENGLYDAYQIGLIDENWLYGSKEHMTRIEIAKLFNYIGNKLGMDISNYNVIDYQDINNVEDSNKKFIYFVASKGLIMGDGINFRPYDYCTYQEAYIILMRLYDSL